MQEAVGRFVPDGAFVCMGTALEGFIPFAAGCVVRIQAAWVGNVSAGLGHNCRRAVGHGVPHPIAVEDQSNLTIAAALQAGAMGAPDIPTRSLLDTGLPDSNPTFKQPPDPFSGDPVVLIPALRPDGAIVHVQRSDAEGHAHCWGTLGATRTVEGARAWLGHWAFGVADWKGFLSTLGPEAREGVRVKTPRLSEPLDYGA